MCHGKDGDGNGDLATDMKLKLLDYRDPASLKDLTDGDLFYIIKNGKAIFGTFIVFYWFRFVMYALVQRLVLLRPSFSARSRIIATSMQVQERVTSEYQRRGVRPPPIHVQHRAVPIGAGARRRTKTRNCRAANPILFSWRPSSRARTTR